MKWYNYKLLMPLLLAAAMGYGQAPKRDVTVDDYAKWGTLYEEAISPDGKWVTYGIRYDAGPDTLFVQNCDS